jgi:BirA family biotin operon repressor/biotin-[acetyl-CoA-carboxylase] ligase
LLVIRLSKVTSTQDFAEAIYQMIEEDEFVVVADEQTRARGRYRRAWFSPKGGLWVTYVIKGFDPSKIPNLTLANALAIREALSKYVDAKIRWPNDVVVNDKKIAGTLIEAVVQGSDAVAFVGFGVDTNVRRFEPGLNATSVLLETGKEVDNDELLNEIIALTKAYAAKEMRELAEEVNKYSSVNGKKVRLVGNGWEKACTALFVDFMGRLVADCGIYEVEEVLRLEVI